MNKPEKPVQRTRIIWWGLGMAGVLLTIIPYVLLGEDGIYTYADQLDGELIAYILQAKHLFQGESIPEFMNGVSKTALTLPAPLAVLLFLPGNYCAALFAMALGGKLCGYIGMYLLARDLTGEAWAAAILGFLYSCIPFLPVYGLAQYGLPMLFWCALLIREGKHLPGAYCGIIIYGLCSSLILIGFGVLGMGAVWILWQSLRRKGEEEQERSSVLRLWAAFALLLLGKTGDCWGSCWAAERNLCPIRQIMCWKEAPFWKHFGTAFSTENSTARDIISCFWHILFLPQRWDGPVCAAKRPGIPGAVGRYIHC